MYMYILKVVSVGKRRRSDDGKRRGSEGGTLVLSVHHPEPSVRVSAVRQLGRLLKHKNKVSLGRFETCVLISWMLAHFFSHVVLYDNISCVLTCPDMSCRTSFSVSPPPPPPPAEEYFM